MVRVRLHSSSGGCKREGGNLMIPNDRVVLCQRQVKERERGRRRGPAVLNLSCLSYASPTPWSAVNVDVNETLDDLHRVPHRHHPRG